MQTIGSQARWRDNFLVTTYDGNLWGQIIKRNPFIGVYGAQGTLSSVGQDVRSYYAVNLSRQSIDGSPSSEITELDAQAVVYNELLWKRMTVFVRSNDANQACILRTRINGAFGKQSITIPANSGLVVLQDLLNIDSLHNGDKICYSIHPVALITVGNLTIQSISSEVE